MALTPEGALLTEAHRIAQANIAADTLADMASAWQLLDPADLDLTTARWLRVSVPVVARHHDDSANLARAYMSRLRAVEATTAGPLALPVAPVLNVGQAATSLTVTGPVAVRVATAAGLPLHEASMAGLARSGSAAGRLALAAGRQTITDTVTSDPAAHGARRVTSAGCCAFCAMLASRDYYALSSAYFQAHDGCHCQPEPAYSSGEGATRQARAFADIYARSTAGVPSAGDGKLNAFRKALEASRTS